MTGKHTAKSKYRPAQLSFEVPKRGGRRSVDTTRRQYRRHLTGSLGGSAAAHCGKPPPFRQRRSYSELFEEAFGSPEVTPARIASAIATFERTVYSDRTPFDEMVSGISQLNAAEVRGQGVFNQSRCNVCHAGTLVSDNAFHNIGVRPQTEDTGRFQVTGNANNIGEFRTPSLRNVSLRGPYFHDGKFATLEEVVEFYNRGGDFDAHNINHNLIRPLNLAPQQKADLLAFLRRPLTDPRVAAGTAPFD